MPELLCYRLSNHDTPLWAHPNTLENRYNKPLEGPTQYLALHPLTPWCELLRRQDLRDPDLLSEMRMRVWALRVEADEVQELTFDNPGEELSADDLVADDWGPCQDFATRFRDTNPMAALIVPSAALPGTRNVVLFGVRASVPYLAPKRGRIDVALSVAGEDARAPANLLPMVRFEGQQHEALEAWRMGRPFAFREPAVG